MTIDSMSANCGQDPKVADHLGDTRISPTNIAGSDDAPTAVTLSNAAVDENSAGEVVIGDLAALDVDHGAAATFNLIDSAGGRFAVVSATSWSLLTEHHSTSSRPKPMT